MKKTLLLKTMLLLCAILFGTSSSWADDYSYTFNASSDAKKNAENTLGGKKWTLTTDPESPYWANEAAGLHVGSSGAGVKTITLSSSDFSGKISKVVVNTKGNGTGGTVSVTVGGTAYTAKNNDNAIETNSKDLEFTGNSSGTIIIVAGYSSTVKKNVYITSIVVTYEEDARTEVATIGDLGLTTLDYGAEGTFAPSIMPAEGLSASDYTVAWDEVDNAQLTLLESGEYVAGTTKGNVDVKVTVSPVSAKESTHKAVSKIYTIKIVDPNAGQGTEAKPFSPSEAITAYNGEELESDTYYYISGVVSYVSSSISSGSFSYYISDDGEEDGNTQVKELQCYKGKSINGADFTSETIPEVGDRVTVKGKVSTYSGNVQLSANNEIVSISSRTKVNISTFTATTTTIVIGESTETTVTNDQVGWTPVSYTYESDDESVATVDANGVVTAVAIGTANITVTANVAPEDATYKTGESKSLEITVTKPFHNVIFSVNGVAGAPVSTEEDADIVFPADPASVGGKEFVGWTTAAIAGTTDEAPTLITSATMGNADITYYAVFAKVSGTPATLTKMASDETLSDGDKIVIVANDGTTEYALYQKESKTTYIDKYVFDGQVETVAADDLNWVTANAEADEKWSFGDATNGYIYNSSKNEFKIDKSNKTSFTVAFNSDNNGFTIKNGSRWFAYRADLTEANQLFRGAGNSTTPTDGSVAYFDIYKYVAGNANYSGYCTSVNATATIPANKEWITFCSPYNLDFTSDIAGLEGAYTITAHADKATTLTATKMTGKVKAGTGLLLRAAAVDNTNDQVINIPVATTGDEQADNMLKGVTADTEVQPIDGDYTNLGLSNGEFHPYSAAGTLAAGKAYLQVPTAQMPTGGNNARLYIVLDGEATGINAIENSELRIENLDAPMYNLAGQRVTKSYKGVVIVNGKKYINK